MHFIFAKIFERNLKHERMEGAISRTVGYISMFYFVLIFSVFLPISVAIEKSIFSSKPENHHIFSFIFVGFIFLFTWLIIKFYYQRSGILLRLREKHESKKINGFLLSLLAFLALMTLFFLGPTLTVLLNGGSILKWEFIGILNK